MAKVHRTTGGVTRYLFHCPGCNEGHAVTDSWSFNGDFDRPAFSPSIKVSGTRLTEKGEQQYQEWVDSGHSKLAEPLDSIPTICHSYVKDGRIQFLSDCTHPLVRQTVDLPDIDELRRNCDDSETS